MVNPPWRLDPLQRIVGGHWKRRRKKKKSPSGGEPPLPNGGTPAPGTTLYAAPYWGCLDMDLILLVYGGKAIGYESFGNPVCSTGVWVTYVYVYEDNGTGSPPPSIPDSTLPGGTIVRL